MINDSSQGTVTRGTPKGLDSQDRSAHPSSYLVRNMTIINQTGQEYDLQPLVTDFSITEEIYSPILVLTLSVRDAVNFFESFSLTGQEVIRLNLYKEDSTSKRVRSLDLKFSVKEYPDYQKSAQGLAVQEYTIVAISDYAYLSGLQKISRSVKDNPVLEIKKIFERDLGVTKFDTDLCVTTFNGIITTQSPLKASEWLRTKSYDSVGSPFFLFARISEPGTVFIKSWAKLIERTNYPNSDFVYQYKEWFEGTPEDGGGYEEQLKRIYNLNSNIRLDKLSQAQSGGFANTIEVSDLANKLFSSSVKSLKGDPLVAFNTLNKSIKTQTFGEALQFHFNGKTNPKLSMTDMANAAISRIATNPSAFEGGQNSSGVLAESLGRAKIYAANIESMTHTVVLNGDFGFNPGKKIKIEVPKATDTPEEELDKSFSGEYVIASVVHQFVDGVYKIISKIVKDRA